MSTEAFYDELAPYYKLLFPDWEASARRHAASLAAVIREYARPETTTLLDAACGIGTQCLGLAELGYRVCGSDLSEAAVNRARAEATARGLTVDRTAGGEPDIDLRVGDMRGLWDLWGRTFDAVIACDNAVPHLLSKALILQACQAFYRCTNPGGVCLVSVRDYAVMERPPSGFKLYPRLAHATENGRVVLFDVWDFNGDYYDVTIYVVPDEGGPTAQARIIRGGRYYCVTIETLEALLAQAGFRHVETQRARYFQPLIVAVK